MDPCTPKGYEGHVEKIAAHSSVCAVSSAHRAVLPGQENTPFSTILSAGNFSECRRVAVSLLQQGKGTVGFPVQVWYMYESGIHSDCRGMLAESCLHTRCAIGSEFIPSLRGRFFGTENFFYTSQVS